MTILSGSVHNFDRDRIKRKVDFSEIHKSGNGTDVHDNPSSLPAFVLCAQSQSRQQIIKHYLYSPSRMPGWADVGPEVPRGADKRKIYLCGCS
jgi:hypothetical protein